LRRSSVSRALARSPHLHHLTELSAYANKINHAAVRALTSSPMLDRVRILRLGGNHPIIDAGARALTLSRHLERLERLELGTTVSGRKVSGCCANASAPVFSSDESRTRRFCQAARNFFNSRSSNRASGATPASGKE